jgi:hypothetical protein
MSVWVNVWQRAMKTMRGVTLLALVVSMSGCIDDFDDPKGYGAATGGNDERGSSRSGCFELCERAASCPGADELDCKRECVELEVDAEAAGCSEEWADFVECALELETLCANQGACDASVARFARCASI